MLILNFKSKKKHTGSNLNGSWGLFDRLVVQLNVESVPNSLQRNEANFEILVSGVTDEGRCSASVFASNDGLEGNRLGGYTKETLDFMLRRVKGKRRRTKG